MELDPERPILHALVGFYCPPFGLIRRPLLVPLEDAVDYKRFGYIVLVDPADERELAGYERLLRHAQFWDGRDRRRRT